MIFLSLMLALASAGERELRDCDGLLNDSSLRERAYDQLLTHLPYQVQRLPTDWGLNWTIKNAIMIPGEGAILAIRAEHLESRAPFAGKSTKLIFVRMRTDGSFAEAMPSGEKENFFKAVNGAIGIAALASYDAVHREYKAGPVFPFAGERTVVAIFDPNRFDDLPEVPYLLLLQSGRISAISETADRGTADAKMRLLVAFHRYVRENRPNIHIIHLQASLIGLSKLIVRMEAIDENGGLNFNTFEISRSGTTNQYPVRQVNGEGLRPERPSQTQAD